MLFNSYVFLFAFAPLSVAGFYLLGRFGRRPAALWLVLVSFVFYGWWNPQFVSLLAVSIILNFVAAELIARSEQRLRLQTAVLTFAIIANLTALGYYKYLAAIIHGITGLSPIDASAPDIVLPLGISFFTFTQIAYLVDVKQGVAKERGLLNYVLFVTFFPHLIAGPILHNQEIMPQFGDAGTYRFSAENLAIGLSIFTIGLLKKCLLADPLSTTVAAGFAPGSHPTLLTAWDAALSFSLQLYFDFSGYSDMAIGLARMFNVVFPLNFNSPYKATSIIDHWRRWHMTLSRYLALYLYNPVAVAITRWRAAHNLSIGRKGHATVGGFVSMIAFPTMVTMGLAGVWHGAGYQYLIFGLLHGIYLVINHIARLIRPRAAGAQDTMAKHCGKILVTYLAVLAASIFFRAPSVSTALDILAGMMGLHSIGVVPLTPVIIDHLGGLGQVLMAHGIVSSLSRGLFIGQASHVVWIICLYGIVWGMPNTQQIMCRFKPALGTIQPGSLQALNWEFTRGWAVAMGVAATLGVLAVGGTSEFLYFQF